MRPTFNFYKNHQQQRKRKNKERKKLLQLTPLSQSSFRNTKLKGITLDF